MAPIFTAPVVNFPLATAVCSLSVGVIVVPACVDNCSVLLPLTLTVPAVPSETNPADTVGVTDFDPLTDAVIRPVFALTLIDGLAVMLVVGVVADPLATALLAALG
jgi:hypothetical protein